MQKRLRQKESTIVTASHPNLYADISEIALREYHFPEVARNFASASEIHNADDSEITQREGITEVQSNVVYASFENYADTSEIAPREYKTPEVANAVYASADDYADTCEISPRDNEDPQVSTNVAYASASAC